jgi:hypothetical protein
MFPNGMDETATVSDKITSVGNHSGGQMKASRLLVRSHVWVRFVRKGVSSFGRATGHKFQNTPLMTVLFATSTSLLMYQNCSPTMQSENGSANKNAVYSSTVGMGGAGSGAGGGAVGSGGSYAPGMGGGGTVGGVMPIGGGTGGGGTTPGGGGTGGGTVGGVMPIGGGTGGGGTIPVGGGTGGGGIVGGGNTGVNPGGTTGGSEMTDSLMWQYQPEDRTIEEGEVLTLGAYAMKGIDVVTYQWYKNGSPISGQTAYMFRQFMAPLSAAGQYHVEARSGNSSIRSVNVTVKVKAARSPCAAGGYGYYPGTRNFNEYFHESIISAQYAPYRLQAELADSYTVRMPYANPSGVGGNCVAASALFQCRNGKLINTDALRCDQYYEGY